MDVCECVGVGVCVGVDCVTVCDCQSVRLEDKSSIQIHLPAAQRQSVQWKKTAEESQCTSCLLSFHRMLEKGRRLISRLTLTRLLYCLSLSLSLAHSIASRSQFGHQLFLVTSG